MRLRAALCAVLCSALHPAADAAFERTASDPRLAALGGAGTALTGHPWGAESNPAGMSLAVRTLAAAYTPATFGLTELARGAFAYVEPLPWFSLSAGASTFGFELYRETDAYLSCAVPVTGDFTAGATLHGYFLSVEGYGSDNAVGVDLGGVLRLSEGLTWGVAIANLNGPAVSGEDELLPRVFSTGLAWLPAEGVTLVADVVKDVGHPLEVRAGAAYRVLEALELRAGTGTQPSTLAAGAGVATSSFRLDYAFTSHPDLGATHRFGVTIELGGR